MGLVDAAALEWRSLTSEFRRNGGQNGAVADGQSVKPKWNCASRNSCAKNSTLLALLQSTVRQGCLIRLGIEKRDREIDSTIEEKTDEEKADETRDNSRPTETWVGEIDIP
ncbi:hypothetical protein [Bradyrhizobium liaoningense]|uniref:hypothetical protein n=1 Tax=Bradyrhizobium liaoningense TaxID=43992 RepID=UPI0012FD1C73|nr:hypothetical protein [Bradyrhizobium liaoningense]